MDGVADGGEAVVIRPGGGEASSRERFRAGCEVLGDVGSMAVRGCPWHVFDPISYQRFKVDISDCKVMSRTDIRQA